jgi:hypothetical protein
MKLGSVKHPGELHVQRRPSNERFGHVFDDGKEGSLSE